MLAILNSLNAHNFPIFQPILMILVSKFMVHRALSDKIYLSLGLLPPLKSHQRLKYTTNLSVTSHINCMVACRPDKHWLSQGICLYQVMMTLHFLNDIA